MQVMFDTLLTSMPFVKSGKLRMLAVTMSQRLTDVGAVPVGGPPERLAAFQRAEQAKWGKVIQAAKVKPE